MKKLLRFFLCLLLSVVATVSADAAIISQGGWFESAYVQWTAVDKATDYNVYVKAAGGHYTQLDKQLVRHYPYGYRADAVGLAAGSYQLKVVPVSGGSEMADAAMETSDITVVAHDRQGFAHVGMEGGVGAYKNDGTLKDNARILYVTSNNAKTVSLSMKVGSSEETRTGLQDIIQAYEKGKETRPLAVRIVGTIKAEDMDGFGSSEEGLQVKGNGSAKCNAQLTIEGIGDDATIHGFGILCRSISNVEFRNFSIMLCMDDCLSLDTDNKNIWVHNMDFFYGSTGGDADQAKGDGTVDIKSKSSHVTVSYNHFVDSGKSSLGGMKSETTDCWMTYHHNWFDHSDSRHPRIRTAFYHVVNNYFDGNSKYGVGVTMGGSSFVEANNFRNCKYPMLISLQGTDGQGDGTFNGENGGVIKAFNNIVRNPKQVLYHDGKQTDGLWDAVKVDSREAEVQDTAFVGGTHYNNAATAAAIAAYTNVEDPATIPATVRGDLGAGRIGHGDFKWSFDNSVQDSNYGVIKELKSAVAGYVSTLIGFADGTPIKNGGATTTVDGGDGKGIPQEVNDNVVPSWGSGGDTPEEEDVDEEGYIASPDNDIFWFGENSAVTDKYVADCVISVSEGSKWDGTFYTTTTSGGVTYTSDHVGAFNLAKASAAKTYDGGSIVFYCPKGVTTFKFNALRSGNAHYQILKSTDGVNYTVATKVEDQKAGIFTKDVSTSVRDLESASPMWVKIVNGSTGSFYVFGVQINQLASGGTLEPSDLTAVTTAKSLNIGDDYTLVKGVDFTTSSTGAISFSTSNPAIVQVTQEGKITALTEGTATIKISQAKDETHKAGSVSIALTSVDPRAASTFALTSAATVQLKETETSQITVTGAAGNVAYHSTNTAIATVDNNGLITAVAPGTVVITIDDSGSSTVKGGSAKVTVTVLKDMTGIEICSFNASTKSPSSPMVVVNGSYSNSKGSVTYGGQTYTDCVKMETATSVKITPSAKCKITLIFDVAGKTIILDGVKKTTAADATYQFEGEAGQTYELKKGDGMNLFLIVFEPISAGIHNVATDAAASSRMYLLNGIQVKSAKKGLYIQNGKKFMVK